MVKLGSWFRPVHLVVHAAGALFLAGCAAPGPLAQVSDEPVREAPPAPPEAEDAQRAPSPLLAGLSETEIARLQIAAKRHYRRHWETIASRSCYVRQRIVTTLEMLDAPRDLQLVPVVESGYNPYALSRSGALGLWQLMPATARWLGVARQPGIDGRRAVGESSRAGVRYLLRLRERFGHWPLALAAYHLGPSAVARRLERSPWRPSDGLDALPMPRVTRDYVSRILGLVTLRRLGVLRLPEPHPTITVKVEPPVDLLRLAREAGADPEILFRYNPGFDHSQYLRRGILLEVPADLAPAIERAARASAPDHVQVAIERGDSLWSLARRYGTTTAHLKRLNPDLGRVLRIGEELTVPASRLSAATPQPNPLLSRGRHIRYRVRRGDTLWGIASRFGTSPAAIARANRMRPDEVIRPGDRLWIVARLRPSH